MLETTSTHAKRGLVVVFSRDLFFGMRIRTTLRGMNYGDALTQDADTFTHRLTNAQERVVLGIIDFNQPVDWSEFALAVDSSVPILAFGAHTDVDGFRSARAAGVTRVLSNGTFSGSLPDLLQKYASRFPDTEE